MSIQTEEAKSPATNIDIAALIEHVPGIPIAEFRKDLSECLNRVRYQKERLPLARHDKNVAMLVSTADSDTLFLLDKIASKFGIEREELIVALLEAGEKDMPFGGVVSSKEQSRLEKLNAAAKKLGVTPDELLQHTMETAEKSDRIREERKLCDT